MKKLRKVISLVRKKLILTPIMLILCVATTPMCMANPDITPTMWLDPPRINGTGKLGETIRVNVTVSSPDIGIWSWQAGISYNSSILSCTNLGEGDFYTGHTTTGFNPGTINNVAGTVAFSGNSLRQPETQGVNGTGVLMWFDFEVLAEGISDLHLRNMKVNKIGLYGPEWTPCNVLDVYTVIWNSGEYLVEIVHDSTGTGLPSTGLWGHSFNQTAKTISFNVSGVIFDSYFCNVTIPDDLLWVTTLDEWMVIIDGTPSVSRTVTYNTTHYSIYFTYTHASTEYVEIQGTEVVPEFPTLTFLLLLMMATIAAAVVGKKVWSIKHKDVITQ